MFFVDCKIIQKTKVPQDNASSFPPRAPPTLHQAGRVGHGRHGGGTPTLYEGINDVGLDFFASFLVKQKGRNSYTQSLSAVR